MSRRTLFLILLIVAIVLTMIGLGFSAYNYYIFDKPFINSTTVGLLSTFCISILMIIIGLSNAE
ncbi:bacteriocin immunity protein [Streptococcus suis]